ncbi:hypothetical protein MSNKSG1_02108 [Marinobacter santoriniensis NKSG1]|uniref:Uncharacterized protein n=1 Tax=Marinobacter santoriniensis NKSG1 TaxID=1288826 RepID=M7CUX8_9GAMM|nr:hypothetical protein [Marinobacter santoriniensis]EMP57376.1 hypothetical protein MSNKSG1_02108 [Marinobacter santoriniensis NKSG1]
METSLIISALALVTSAYSIYETRRNNRLGQSPTIVGHENESPTEYSYSITNKGNGPAYFEKVQYFLNLQPIEDKPLGEYLKEILNKNEIRYSSSITNLGQKSVMAAGEVITLAKIAFPAEDSEKFQNLDQEFSVRIVYNSLHGDEQVWCSDSRLENI